MGKKICRRISVSLLLIYFLLSTSVLPYISAYAMTTGGATGLLDTNASGTTASTGLMNQTINSEVAGSDDGSSASDMSKTMLEFFKDERAVNVSGLSKDEMMIYGIFISNFYKPYETTVKDIKSETGIAGVISKQFFNSETKAKEVAQVNTVIYDGIFTGLSKTPQDWGLYANKEKATAGSPMAGKTVVKKLGGSGEGKLLGKNNSVIFDFSNKAHLASWRTLFAYSPDMFLDANKGLSKVQGLFIDGFGNVWGRPSAETPVDDYVLIMPAVMNAVTYNGKYPMANVFATGNIMNIDSGSLATKGNMIPYYNLNTLTKTNGVLNFVGIQSASEFLGRSDELVGTNATATAHKHIKTMVGESVVNPSSGKNLIFMAIDTSKLKNDFSDIAKGFDLSTKQAQQVLGTLTDTVTFMPEEVSQTMYFFNTKYQNQASDNSLGTWQDIKSMSQTFNLFTYDNNGSFQFYNDASAPSPLLSAIASSFGDNKKATSQAKSLLGSGAKDAQIKALASFLEKGTGGNGKDLQSAFKTLSKESSPLFEVLPPNKTASREATNNTFLGLIDYGAKSVGFMLTDKDDAVTMGSALKVSGFLKRLTATNDTKIPAKSPFVGFDASSNVLTLSGYATIDRSKLDGEVARKRMEELVYLFGVYRAYTTNKSFLNMVGTNNTASGSKISGPLGEGKTGSVVADTSNAFAGMYWAYLRELLNATVDSSGKITSSSFNNSSLPSISLSVTGSGFGTDSLFTDNTSSQSDKKTEGDMTSELIKRIYNITSSEINTEKMGYVKAMTDSAILEMHRSITNSWANGKYTIATTSGEGYQPSFNYIKSPTLSEIPYASTLLSNYLYFYIIVMLFVILFAVITTLFKIYTPAQGVVMFALMALLLLVPQYFVGGVSSFTNVVGDKLLSERFNYWAILQHQTSENQLAKAEEAGNFEEQLAQNFEQQKQTTGDNRSSASVNGVTIKWMAPKRTDVFKQIFSNETDKALLETRGSLFKWLMASYFYEEEFVYDDPLATYLYKSYNTVASDAKLNYENMLNTSSSLTAENMASIISSYKANDELFNSERYAVVGQSNYEAVNEEINYTAEDIKNLKLARPLGSSEGTPNDSHRFWGVSNGTITRDILRTDYQLDNAGITLEETDPEYEAFARITESPYFYFYNLFKNKYASEGKSFKSVLLDESVFRVVEEEASVEMYGQLRDFLDLEGLFTYVIPYLADANEYVYGWTGVYGSKIETFNFEEGAISASAEKATEQTSEGQTNVQNTQNTQAPTSDSGLDEMFSYEKAKKEALGEVWKAYSPWVDQLYSASFGNRISISQKDRDNVTDPLNASSYVIAGRPMVFSPAHMKANFLDYGYLSDVEERLINITNKTYEDLMYLNNYRDFSEESLLSMAAMIATFNFNKEFSSINILGESVLLYPQSFELQNFNYDAYMRMAIMKASGEGVQDDKDLYERVLAKTSVFTGITLIIKDFFGVYVVPVARVIVLSLLFFLTFAFCVVSLLAPPEYLLGRLMTVLVKPAFWYALSTVGFTFLIAMFLGEGVTNYVGTNMSTFSLSDPTTSMFGMLIIDIIYVAILSWLAFRLIKDLKDHIVLAWALLKSIGSQILKSIKASIGGMTSDKVSTTGDIMASGKINTTGGLFGGVLRKGGSGIGSFVRGTRAMYNRRRMKKRQQLQDDTYTAWLDALTNGSTGGGPVVESGQSENTEVKQKPRKNGSENEDTTSNGSIKQSIDSAVEPSDIPQDTKQKTRKQKVKDLVFGVTKASARTVGQTVSDVAQAGLRTAGQTAQGVYIKGQYEKVKDGVKGQYEKVKDSTLNYTEKGVNYVKRAGSDTSMFVGNSLKTVGKTIMSSKTAKFLNDKGTTLADRTGNVVKTGKEKIVLSSFSQNLTQVRSERARAQASSAVRRTRKTLPTVVEQGGLANEREQTIVNVKPKRLDGRRKKRRKKRRNRK